MEEPLKILVVEDDPQVQEFMSTILEFEGCKNDSAFTGPDAIDFIKNTDYDLVFLDLEIPEIHGLDVLSKIKSIHAVTKSVILTGFASKESAIRALKEGAYDFIEKPFSIHQITRIVQNVQEEKKLERENDRLLRELKQTKNFLEKIHSNIGAGIIVCDEDGKIMSHNSQAANIWETGEKSLLGKNLGEISSDKKFQKLFSKMKSGTLTSIYKEQIILQKADRSQKNLILTVSPLKEENFSGFVCLIDDITLTSKLEEKLSLSEEKYRNLVERANDGIFRIDINGKFLFANKKILDVFGLYKEDLMKKHFHELLKEKYRKQFLHNLELLRKKEKIDRFRVELFNKKRKKIWLDLNVVTVRENEKITGFEGIARDITESLIMEHQKKELEQLNLNILKCISSPHFVIDRKYSIIYHNEYAKELMKSNGDLIDKNFFSVTPPEFQKKLKEPFISLFKGETNNIRLRIGSGKEKGDDFDKVYEVSGYPYSTPTNYIKGIFVLVENITYQYKSEKKLSQADKLATIGKLASGVAHEIRNPLNIIRGVVQYIQETQNTDDSVTGFLKILKDEVNRVTLFLDDFLSLTKQKELKLTKIDINELLDSVLKFFIHELNSRKIHLTKKLTNHPLSVMVDENQIRQVILNILKNSTEAISGRRKRAIKINTGFVNNTKNAVLIEIEDTGCGIPKKVADKIFEPFFSTKKAGSGLGLAICVEIIKNHNGTITFESVLKKGSKMKIILPSSESMMNNSKEDKK